MGEKLEDELRDASKFLHYLGKWNAANALTILANTCRDREIDSIEILLHKIEVEHVAALARLHDTGRKQPQKEGKNTETTDK